jgi:hypothetical protein
MKSRILVTGFQRSGTTLLRRLLCQHPDVDYIIHEGRLIQKANSKVALTNMARSIAHEQGHDIDTKRGVWGDKVPFPAGRPGPVEYYRKWMKMFGRSARVVLIVRHPYDVAVSSKRTFDQSAEKIIKAYAAVMPRVMREALRDNVLIIKFEELLASPIPEMKRVLKYCKLNHSDDVVRKMAASGKEELRYFDGIESSRAFAYKAGKVPPCPCNLFPAIGLLNQVPGPPYELEYNFDSTIVCPRDKDSLRRIDQYREYYHTKYDLAKRVAPKTIVEIGVRAGYSAWAFLCACPTAKYYGFDAENGTHGGRGGPWAPWARKMLAERGFDVEIAAPADTQSMDKMPIAADLYHVDGDHTPDGVYHDLTICFEAAPVGAVLLVDDYDYEEAAGVRKGVDRWLKDFAEHVKAKHVPSLRGEMMITVRSKR